MLARKQARDDYRELLELTMTALGSTPFRSSSRSHFFIRPGALHRARWIDRVIYSIKIYLFRGQFQLKQKEEKGLKVFVIFSLNIYICSWFRAPDAAGAPMNYLHLLMDLASYSDRNISRVAVRAFSRHLWYLSEELAALALFDPRVTDVQKREIVQAMANPGPQFP